MSVYFLQAKTNILFDRHDGSVCVDALAKHLGIEVHKMEQSTRPVYGNGKKTLVVMKGPAGYRLAFTGVHEFCHFKCSREIGILTHGTYESCLDGIKRIGLSSTDRGAICFSKGGRGFWRKDATHGIQLDLENASFVFYENILNGIVYGYSLWNEHEENWSGIIDLKLDREESAQLAKMIKFSDSQDFSVPLVEATWLPSFKNFFLF